MPIAPPTVCQCGGLRNGGVCDRCGPKKRQPHTRKTSQRGYDWAWQQFRERYLEANPLCVDCLPRVTAASEVHHVRKIKDRPDLRLDEANVMGLCGPCHAKRTAKGE